MINSEIPNKDIEIPESPENNPRQQDKIIAFVTGKTDKVDSRFEYVSENEREMFYSDLQNGKYGNGDFDKMLHKVRGPIYENEQFEKSNSIDVYEKISLDKRQMGIVAIFTAEDLTKADKMQPRDLYDFLKKYPTPIAFEDACEAYLKYVEEKCGTECKKLWEQSMVQFHESIYGKRYEYYKQINLMKKEANRRAANGENVFTPKINHILESESDAILKATEIEGDPFNGKSLTSEILKKEGLEPKYSFEIDGSTIVFSKNAFNCDDRVGIIGYVLKDGKVFARSYYLSGSQGCWRYLPGYTKRMKNGKEVVDWYSKGYEENSVTLPAVTQNVLATLMQKEYSVPKNTKNDPDFILAGTAKTHSELYEAQSPSMNRGKAYYQEMSKESIKLKADWYDRYSSDEKVPPEELVLEDSESPDFSKVVLSWRMPTNVYGEIVSRVFKSKDGRFAYTFSTTSDGKSWITSIEDNNARVDGTTGLKNSRIFPRDLTTPCAEYWEQGKGYIVNNRNYGEYDSMYENYNSKIPVIKEYTEKFVENN